MKTVNFWPIRESLEIRTQSRILDAMLAQELNVLMACGGKGLCATCHVHVKDGGDKLTPQTDREKRTLSFVSGCSEDSRLACQARILGEGVTVQLPDGMFIEKAEDLMAYLGTRAPSAVFHPITGITLIAKGKIITKSRIRDLEKLNVEVEQLKSHS